MSLKADLATLRETLDRYANHERSASFHVALDRVEAEIARLQKIERNNSVLFDKWKAAEAEAARLRAVIRDEEMEARYAARAEAEVARLRDGLRRIDAYLDRCEESGGAPSTVTIRGTTRALRAEDGAALTAGEQPEEARHRGESRNPQGVLDGNANPAPAVSAEDGAA